MYSLGYGAITNATTVLDIGCNSEGYFIVGSLKVTAGTVESAYVSHILEVFAWCLLRDKQKEAPDDRKVNQPVAQLGPWGSVKAEDGKERNRHREPAVCEHGKVGNEKAPTVAFFSEVVRRDEIGRIACCLIDIDIIRHVVIAQAVLEVDICLFVEVFLDPRCETSGMAFFIWGLALIGGLLVAEQLLF